MGMNRKDDAGRQVEINDPEIGRIVDQKFLHVLLVKFAGLGQLCFFHNQLLEQFILFVRVESRCFILNFAP
jgi:hypothetical protein